MIWQMLLSLPVALGLTAYLALCGWFIVLVVRWVLELTTARGKERRERETFDAVMREYHRRGGKW